MSQPTRKLNAVRQLADHLAAVWATYEAVEAMLALPTIRTTGGGTHGGDVSRPVEAQAISHEHYFETVTIIDEALGLLRIAQARVTNVLRSEPETARQVDAAVRAARCTGVVGDDPTCTGLAVRNVEVDDPGHPARGTRQPTCWACIKRAQRRDEAAEEAS